MRAARAAGGGGGKTLYEQLEAEREKQQEAYDANTKALFSPGEVLDDLDTLLPVQSQGAAQNAAEERDQAGELCGPA